MNNGEKLMERVRTLLEDRGRNAYESAKEEVTSEEIEYTPIREALEYFIQELWRSFHHPALLSLACESVGGNPEDTVSLGAALVLLTGAADVHDDIIDQSTTKGSKPTVFGRFGRDVALLVGDALLLKGFALLNKACEDLPKRKGQTIMGLVRKAFFEIGVAEAKEASFKGNWDLAPEEYLSIIRMKAAIAEYTARIGGIVGEGSPEEIEALGKYGRALGTLATIRDDFIDTFEPDELKNRAEKECLPLPILYAFRDEKLRNRIVNILGKTELSEDDAYNIVEIVSETENAQALKREMQLILKSGVESLEAVRNQNLKNKLGEMIQSATEDL